MSNLDTSALWTETKLGPNVVSATLSDSSGVEDAVRYLRRAGTRRLIAVGNGASYHAAHALWLASLRSPKASISVLAVPVGMLSTGSVALGPGDAVLSFSVSGELSDLLEQLPSLPSGVPRLAVTCSPSSGLANLSEVVLGVSPDRLDAPTHSHAYLGAVAAALNLWSRLAEDADLRGRLDLVPHQLQGMIDTAPGWARSALGDGLPRSCAVFGPGGGWSAALEAALMLKEVALLPCEGVESREASTSIMTMLRSDDLVIEISADDRTSRQAREACTARRAKVVRIPGLDSTDERLLPLVSFPHSAMLALVLAERQGLDPDHPDWVNTYETTARMGAGTSMI